MDETKTGSKRETPILEGVECVSEGWLNKYVLTYRLPDGSEYHYESVSRKGPEEYRKALEENGSPAREKGKPRTSQADAVCIVPMLPDGKLLLIREFRYPVNGWVVAFPAGLIDEGESMQEAIDRELMEETGCRVRTDMGSRAIAPFSQSSYASAGMGEENILIVRAHVERVAEPSTERGEFIEAFELAPEDVAEFMDSNEDMIGTRCQLLLDTVRRTNALKKRIALALNPITKEDFA